MKIGIFDSGLGGLLIAKAVRRKLPAYNYAYLGDTKRVPYGGRSHESVYQFTKEGVEYLLNKENCAIVILACNTASARALRRIQEEYLPNKYPDRKVLGVLIPAAEECINLDRVGVLATRGTVASGTFLEEIKKINKKAKIFQNPAPMLVPLAEEGEEKEANHFIKRYLNPILRKNIDALVLGCTHYPLFKKDFSRLVGKNIKIISQDEIIPKKLKEYLDRHPEIKKNLSRKGKAKILVTDITANMEKLSRKWFGAKIKPELIRL